MSLKHKIISTMTLAVAVGAFGTFASAQETPAQDTQNPKAERVERGGKRGGFGRGDGMRGDKRGGDGDRMMMRALEKLNLTDAQKTQVKTILENSRAQNQPQMEEMRGLMMKKRDGVITADEQNRFKELRDQMQSTNEQTHNSILAILTAEQRAQLDKMKEEMRQKMQERRQNRQNQPDQVPPSDN